MQTQAILRFTRLSPQKARLVADLVRTKPVGEAVNILKFSPQGKLGEDGHFTATEVLAKHDENYMPPEAQHAVDEAQKTIKTLK